MTKSVWNMYHDDDGDIITIVSDDARNRIMIHGMDDGRSIDDDTLEGVFVSVTFPQDGHAHFQVGLTVLPYIANSYTVIDLSSYVTTDDHITTYLLIDPHGDTIREIAGDIYRMLID